MLLQLILLLLTIGVSSGRPRGDEKHSVAEIRAVLYFQETGTLGTENVVEGDVEAPPLHHVLTGKYPEGQGPSGATMILIRVTGSFLASTPGNIRFEAKQGGRVLAQRKQPLDDFFSETEGEVWIPFLVYGTGCGGKTTLVATTLSATGKAESTLTRTIDFDCSE